MRLHFHKTGWLLLAVWLLAWPAAAQFGKSTAFRGAAAAKAAAGGGGGAGVYSFIATVGDSGAGNSSVTTASRNTTGAKLITLVVGRYAGTPVISDDASPPNTYTARTAHTSSPGGVYTSQLYDCILPNTSTTHHWTIQVPSGTGYPSIEVYVFGKTGSTPVFDKESSGTLGNGGSATTAAVIPAVVPDGDNELFVAALCADRTGSSVDSGFTGLHSDINSGVGGIGCYFIQTTGASVGPTITLSSSTSVFAGGMGAYK